MNPPPPQVDPDLAKRALDIVEFGAKTALALGAVWAFVARVWTPLYKWRKRHISRIMHEVMSDDLTQLQALVERANTNALQVERLLGQVNVLFGEYTELLDIVHDNRTRIDEANALLDEVGFSSDRRIDPARREEFDVMLEGLTLRRKARSRAGDIPPTEKDS